MGEDFITDHESIVTGIDEGDADISPRSRSPSSENISDDDDMDMDTPVLLMPPSISISDAGLSAFSPPMISNVTPLFGASTLAPSPMREHEVSVSERSSLLRGQGSISFMDAQGLRSDGSPSLRHLRPKFDMQRLRSRESLVSHGHKEGFDPTTGKSTFGQSVWKLCILLSQHAIIDVLRFLKLFNSIAVLLGLGILSEPFAFAAAGWVGGVLITIGYGFVACYVRPFNIPSVILVK